MRPPRGVRGGQPTPTQSVRAFHLAGGWKHGGGRLDLCNQLPAPAGLLFIERLPFRAIAERGDIDRLEELVIVLAHVALAAIEHLELHALERDRYLDRIDRFRLV